MSQCGNCGEEVKDEYNYCVHCGADLDAPTLRDQLIRFIEENPEFVADWLLAADVDVKEQFGDGNSEEDPDAGR